MLVVVTIGSRASLHFLELDDGIADGGAIFFDETCCEFGRSRTSIGDLQGAFLCDDGSAGADTPRRSWYERNPIVELPAWVAATKTIVEELPVITAPKAIIKELPIVAASNK